MSCRTIEKQTVQPGADLTVYTLNYSGIGSPFQFYTSDKIMEQKTISYHFKKIQNIQFQKQKKNIAGLKQFINKLKQNITVGNQNKGQNKLQKLQRLRQVYENMIKNLDHQQVSQNQNLTKNIDNKMFYMGTLDTQWNKLRYAPCYVENAGVIKIQDKKQNKKQKLLNQEEFFEEWNKKCIESLRNDISLLQYIQKKKAEAVIHLYMCRIFDFCSYKTLALWYNIKQFSDQKFNIQNPHSQEIKIEYDTQFSQLKKDDQIVCKNYVQGQEKNFNQLYLKQNYKILKILQLIAKNEYQIYCFQQVSKVFLQVLMNYQNKEFLKEYYKKSGQSINQIILLHLKTYHVVKKNQISDSIILIKKQLFGLKENDSTNKNIDQIINKNRLEIFNQLNRKRCLEQNLKQLQIEKQINFNNDSEFVALPINGKLYFILNVHLTSKKKPKEADAKVQYNQDQVEKLFKYLWYIINLNCILIIAGDFNCNFAKFLIQKKIKYQKQKQKQEQKQEQEQKKKLVEEDEKLQIIKLLSYFPSDINAVTSNKQRTMMQPQGSKAQVLDKSVKDFIISITQLSNQKILTLQQEVQQKNQDDYKNIPIIPTSNHPLDHFAVSAKVLKQKGSTCGKGILQYPGQTKKK